MKASFSSCLLLTILLAGCRTAAPTAAVQPVTRTAPSTPTAPPAPSAPSVPAAPPAPVVIAAQQAKSSTVAGLTVEEYAFGEGKDLPPPGRKLPDQRAKWRGTHASWVEAMNKTLAPYGYRVTFVDDPNIGHPIYTIWQGDLAWMAELDSVQPPAVNSRGDDFLMVVEQAGQSKLLRPGAAEPWDATAHSYTLPVFAGDRAIQVVTESVKAVNVPYHVMSDKEAVFSDQVQWDSTENPIKRLSAWEGHWVLEVSGRVIIDGKDLGAGKGYTQVFGWQVLAGKPFYYFVKDGKTGIVYGDQVFPAHYDTVVHYRCCSPAMFNNSGNEQMVTFFGQRDGQWYYVEIGKYE